MDTNLSKDGSTNITDEVVNTATHLGAACFALLGAIVLITEAVLQKNLWKIVGFVVYGLSLCGLFLFSTLHHGINGGRRTERTLRTLDYAAVFTLIAGTVTPIALVLYRTPIGFSVLTVSWLLAITGIALRASLPRLPKYITSTLYIVLGWLPVIMIASDFSKLNAVGLLLLALGGVVYSAGLILFSLEKPNPVPGKFGFHEIWHIMVVVAAALHYFFMYLVVL